MLKSLDCQHLCDVEMKHYTPYSFGYLDTKIKRIHYQIYVKAMFKGDVIFTLSIGCKCKNVRQWNLNIEKQLFINISVMLTAEITYICCPLLVNNSFLGAEIVMLKCLTISNH